MGLSPAVVLPARANAQAAERNAAIVEHWVNQSLAGDLSGADTLLAAHVTLHAVPGTTTGTRRAFLDFLSNGAAEGGRLQVSQIEVFGEGDEVCVLYSADGHDGPVSAVRFYRVVDERITEAWWGPSAEVRWALDNELNGDLDVQANRHFLPAGTRTSTLRGTGSWFLTSLARPSCAMRTGSSPWGRKSTVTVSAACLEAL